MTNEAKILRAFIGRIAELTLPAEGGIDKRDAIAFFESGAFKDLGTSGDAEDAMSLRSAVEGLRGGESLGPILFYTRPEGGRGGVRVREALLDEQLAVREVAVKYLEHVLRDISRSCASTRGAFERLRQRVVSEKTEDWHDAAIDLVDELDGDWLVTVSGVQQSQHPSLSDVWGEYLSASLRPTNAGIQALAPRPLSPAVHLNEIDALIRKWAGDALRPAQLLKNYLEALGHLPLGAHRSFGGVLSAARPSGLQKDELEELLGAANQTPSRNARYHVCEYLLGANIQLDPSQQKQVAEWVWQIIRAHPQTSEGGKSDPVALEVQFARHFVHFLELRVPSDNSEALAAMAWWLSQRLIASLLKVPDQWNSISRQLEETFDPPISGAWDIIGPAMEPSVLRHLTTRGPSPWSVALLASIVSEEQVRWLMNSADASEVPNRVHEVLSIWTQTANLSFADDGRHFRFASGLEDLFGWVATRTPDSSGREDVAGWPPPIEWNLQDAISRVVERLEQQEAVTQQWQCFGMTQRISSGACNADELWKLVSAERWTNELWGKLDIEAARMVGRCLVDDAALRRPDWFAQLPHLFAELAEKYVENEAHRFLFFELALRACCKCSVGSALLRLRNGPFGHRFRTMTKTVRGNLTEFLPYVGGWAAGRLRAVCVDLGP